ncbi:hypothetical protein [Nocardiopsis sp. NPDC006938]|uniref:hypothetical protein n=1 Tax=Nocardiopsis sp. NPDC006938 TaxID=3364337 RepID=UPI003691E7C3
MNNTGEGRASDPSPRRARPSPPVGMELMEYLHLTEKAESYIRMVGYLYSDLALTEKDPEKKKEYDVESKRHSGLLKSMDWMETSTAKTVVAKYPGLIQALRTRLSESNV